MRRLVWAFGWVSVAIWSLVCALAYGLFDLVGRGMMRSSDAWSSSPETVEGIFKFFSFLHSFSTGAVLVVWAIVSLAILAVPWAVDRMIGRMPAGAMPAPHPGFPRQERQGRQERQERYDGPGGVIDLPPDQYSVGPGGEPRRGGVPTVPPRG